MLKAKLLSLNFNRPNFVVGVTAFLSLFLFFSLSSPSQPIHSLKVTPSSPFVSSVFGSLFVPPIYSTDPCSCRYHTPLLDTQLSTNLLHDQDAIPLSSILTITRGTAGSVRGRYSGVCCRQHEPRWDVQETKRLRGRLQCHQVQHRCDHCSNLFLLRPVRESMQHPVGGVGRCKKRRYSGHTGHVVSCNWRTMRCKGF